MSSLHTIGLILVCGIVLRGFLDVLPCALRGHAPPDNHDCDDAWKCKRCDHLHVEGGE
jgi:hypothetical protein